MSKATAGKAAVGEDVREAEQPARELDGTPKGLVTQDERRKVEPHGNTRYVAGYDVTDVGTGFEDFTQSDVAVPFFAVLQKGSPQVEEENPKNLPGAKAGSIFNTVTNELYDGKAGIVLIPVHRIRTYIEWIPKDDGGGLVNVFQPDAPEVLEVLQKAGRKKFGKHKIGDNNDLVETLSVFSLVVKPDGRTERGVISFSSSQIPGYQKWMTTAQSVQIPDADNPARLVVPPLFSHRYRLTTFFFQKKENTWYKWLAQFADGTPPSADASRIPQSDPLYEQAKEFRTMILSGAAQANYEAAVQEPGADEEGEYSM